MEEGEDTVGDVTRDSSKMEEEEKKDDPTNTDKGDGEEEKKPDEVEEKHVEQSNDEEQLESNRRMTRRRATRQTKPPAVKASGKGADNPKPSTATRDVDVAVRLPEGNTSTPISLSRRVAAEDAPASTAPSNVLSEKKEESVVTRSKRKRETERGGPSSPPLKRRGLEDSLGHKLTRRTSHHDVSKAVTAAVEQKSVTPMQASDVSVEEKKEVEAEKQPAGKEASSKEVLMKETISVEAAPKDTIAKEVSGKETVSTEAPVKENVSHVTVIKEILSKPVTILMERTSDVKRTDPIDIFKMVTPLTSASVALPSTGEKEKATLQVFFK